VAHTQNLADRQRFVPPPKPRTPKSADSRRRLLETAVHLFVERGYAAVSMNDICSAMGLSKGALYGHFRSKGQLLVEVIRWELAERDHRAQLDGTFDHPRDATALFFAPERRRLRFLEVDAAAAARHDPDVAAGLADLYRDRQKQIREATAETADPETAAWLIGALAAGVGMKEAVGMPPPDHDRLVTAIYTALRALI